MSSLERQPKSQLPETEFEHAKARAHNLLDEAETLAQRPDSASYDQRIATLYKQIEEVFKPEVNTDAGQVSPEEAWRIMGDDYMGPVEIQEAFQIEMEDVPPIQFSAEELEQAKELNQQLILFVDKAPDGQPLGLKKMNELLEGKTSDGKKLLYRSEGVGLTSDDWFKDEAFIQEAPRAGWRLVSREIIPGSNNKNYLQQTDLLATYIAKKEPVPARYQRAIGELAEKKKELEQLLSSDWKKAGDILQSLEITNLLRETAPEAIYRLILNERKNKERLLPNKYTWTATRSSDGDFVYVGDFDASGVRVFRSEPGRSYDPLGVCLSRS